jgi:hypothetical protein
MPIWEDRGLSKKKPNIEKLRKDLPPPPSATMARWDSSLSAEQYLQAASSAIAQTKARLSIFRGLSFPDEWHKEEIRKFNRADDFFHEADYQLVQGKSGVTQLLDRENWDCACPKISLHARINQAGNFAVRWTTPHLQSKKGMENRTGFTDVFVEKCWLHAEIYGTSSTELLRFRNVPLQWRCDEDHPALRYIVYALCSKYFAVVRELRRNLEVVDAPGIEFVRDDENHLEWSLV